MTTANGSEMLNSDVIVRHLTGKNIDCSSAYCMNVPLHYTKSVFRGPKKIKSDKKTITKLIIIIIIKAPIFLKYSSRAIRYKSG
jgi:hypothetical protein